MKRHKAQNSQHNWEGEAKVRTVMLLTVKLTAKLQVSQEVRGKTRHM